MRPREINESQRERVKDLLPRMSGDRGGLAADSRGFINAVYWIAKTSAPRRDLPKR